MAGKSSRFEYNFKPFLSLDNRVFIEHVMDSFKNLDVQSYNFIIREEQETLNNITENLKNVFFPNLSNKINIITIDKETKGPFETISLGLNKIKELKNLIICDCDHYVDVSPIVKKIKSDNFLDIVIPTWEIKQADQKNWGKVIVDKNTNSIVKFCEKEVFKNSNHLIAKGIIGCHFFKFSSYITEVSGKYHHFSDFYDKNHKNYNIGMAEIKTAYFFGDPAMAKKAIEDRRRKETIICDVDGVILKHKNCSNDLVDDNFIINNAASKIAKWRKSGKLVVLSTARPERTKESFKTLLESLEIQYDHLVMGLNPGPRYLINDIKPSNPLVRQSLSFNLTRDQGIDKLLLKESGNYNLKSIKLFKGNSFSRTELIQNDDSKFVRKYIIKNKETTEHYHKLRRQLDDLLRLQYYDETLVPKIYDFEDNDYWFYFDMEYLENYLQLDQFSDVVKFDVLGRVIAKLEQQVYCYRKKNNSLKFVHDLYNTKIEPKLQKFQNECSTMNHLINEKQVVINNKKYFGLREVIRRLNIDNFNTEYLSPIHGDLTLENILYNENFEDFKLIDLDGSRYVDSCYFDLGKIFQSTVSNYKEWSQIQNVLLENNVENLICVSDYFKCEKEKYKNICQQYANIMETDDWIDTYKKGIFYMSMYFIRFVPFRRQINKGHGIFAIIMAINWLNYLLNIDE